MKKIIATSWYGCSLDEDKLCCALLQYRNTPSHKDTLSPAQKLYGRPVQDTIPVHRRSFAPDWLKQMDEVDIQETQALQKSQKYYNQHTRHLRIGPK